MTTRLMIALVFLVVSLGRAAVTLVRGDVVFRREPVEAPGRQEGWRLQVDLQQHQQPRRRSSLVAAGPELSSFPSVTNSTILFLHVFKVSRCPRKS